MNSLPLSDSRHYLTSSTPAVITNFEHSDVLNDDSTELNRFTANKKAHSGHIWWEQIMTKAGYICWDMWHMFSSAWASLYISVYFILYILCQNFTSIYDRQMKTLRMFHPVQLLSPPLLPHHSSLISLHSSQHPCVYGADRVVTVSDRHHIISTQGFHKWIHQLSFSFCLFF